MTHKPLHQLAQDLANAWAHATTTPAPSTVEPSLTSSDAYTIQELLIDQRMKDGRRRAGWKMGLTSAQPPATPIVGTLLSDMVVPSGSDLDLATMVSPMVEAEIVIRIGETIHGAQSVAELEQGPYEVAPGLEVIDYRTEDSSGVVDWIADNSTVAYAVVGGFTPIADIRPAEIEGSLYGDGGHLASGGGSKVMGNPLVAVSWLSQHLRERGHPLEEGHVVLTGSLTGHHPVPTTESSEFTAEFGGIGSVTVHFHP